MYQNDFTFARMLLAYRRPFEFRGRSTRTELLGYLIISWLVSVIGSYGVVFFDSASSAFTALLLLGVLLWLPMPALAVRRAHDIGRRWFWSLPLLVPTLIWFVFGGQTLNQIPGALVGIFLMNIVGLVILFWKPDEGTNAFGADPRLDVGCEPYYD